jgi:hypothetical protein
VSSLSRILLCGAFVGVLAFATACKKNDSTPPTPHDSSTVAAATNDAGPLRLELKISPEHPRMIKPTDFALHVTDPNGKPSDGLTVIGRLTMRAMNMGETQLTFAAKGDGNYTGSVKEMDMSGPWTLTVDASGKSGHVQKSFDFVVGE